MSARRLVLGCVLAGACTSAKDVPKDSRGAGEAVSADMSEPPAEEVEAGPQDRHDPRGGMHLAAASSGPLEVAAMADGGVAVFGRGVLAFAPAGAGPLRTDPAWLRGWPDGAFVVGGRWPERAFVTTPAEWTRSAIFYEVRRWQDGAWTRTSTGRESRLVDFYSDYAGWAGGAILGLRGFVTDGFLGDADSGPRELQSQYPELRATVERLDDGPPPPWPPLPPGHAAVSLLAFADGTLVVLRTKPSLLRWTPGTRAWVELPPPPNRDRPGRADSRRPVVVGRDPGRLYAHRCTREDEPWLDRLTDGAWQPLALPAGGCVESLAESPGGTLWLVNDRGLFRWSPPGPEPGQPERWEPIPLPPLDVPGKPTAATSPDVQLPPPGPEPLFAREVVALDRGELWVVAGVGTRDRRLDTREVVLTTRTAIAPLVLRPREMSAGTGP